METKPEPTKEQRKAAEFIIRPKPTLENSTKTSSGVTNKQIAVPGIKKIILAVHGIGDQTRQETIQSVVTRFCAHSGHPRLVPLGAFYAGDPAVALKAPPPPEGWVAELGFAEVYWADIPRQVVTSGYMLQETKAWARCIVQRVRALAEHTAASSVTRGVNYERVGDVLEEMITTIQVLEALTFLAKKAGILDFNLKKLLEDYVGDVQLVTEFQPYRDRIIAAFNQVMEGVSQRYPNSEVYIVAHSEGTVIAWLGMLGAMNNATPPPWLDQVRGFMTFGSPIDKHILMWPELFESFKTPVWRHKGTPIQWFNYSDMGDPIGFELDTARAWMKREGYDQNFDFNEEHDYAFSRYYLPGKAHIDYWQDEAVFGHFIDSVVKPVAGAPKHGPRSKPWAQLCSYVAAYAIALGMVYGGVYLYYKTWVQYLAPDKHPAHMTVNILAVGGLLAGAVVCWRLFRLTRGLKWRLIGIAVFGATLLLYYEFFEATPEIRSFVPFATSTIGSLANWIPSTLSGLTMALLLSTGPGAPGEGPSAGKTRSRARRPQIGEVKGAMILFGAILMLCAGGDWITHRAIRGPLWPLLIAIFAAIYLCWLGTMFFDLVFVWHRYIRHAVALDFMRNALWQHAKSENVNDARPSQ